MLLKGKLPDGKYSELKPELILSTLAKLQHRIDERCPGSGLGQVTLELLHVAHAIVPLLKKMQRPLWGIRALTFLAIGLLLGLTTWLCVLTVRYIPSGESGLVDLLQGSESAINEVIFLSIAIFFLATLESRLKRKTALKSLHRLRSIAHVVDMHQLTKDPAYLLHGTKPTKASPERKLTPRELARYFDYCTELLALNSKLAALHVQYFQDSEVLKTVNEVEMLGHELSDKIWQKIMALDITVTGEGEKKD